MKIYSKGNNNKWYSIIISLLMVGFLLVLTTWIFDLVLREMYDNRGIWNYIKAFAWAESWQELALLKIKEKWYGIYDKIDHDIDTKIWSGTTDESIVLSQNPRDISQFKKSNDVFISYDLRSKVDDYKWKLKPLWYDIIPLFYEDDETWIIHKVSEIDNFSIDIGFLWVPEDLVWNVISEESGISWTTDNLSWFIKTVDTNNHLYYSDTADSINNFLSTTISEKNYLILFNSNKDHDLSYSLKSDQTKPFTKPKTEIISSGQIWNYKQNLRTNINNTEYLNILKYSIYSN